MFAMRRRDDETILVIGQRHDLVHVLDHAAIQADAFRDAFVDDALDGLGPHVGAHRQHPFQRRDNRGFLARRQHVGQILDRDPQVAHIRHPVLGADRARLGGVLDRGKRRDIPHHRQRPVFGMQREGDLPLHRHLPDRALLRGLDPVLRDAVTLRRGDHFGVLGVQEDAQLCLVEVARFMRVRRFLDPVGIVEDDAEIPDSTDAGFRTDGRVAAFDPGIAQGAFLGFAGFPVVIDLLVGAARDAHPPAPAFLLVDQDDAVLLALVDRARGTGGRTGRVEAMFAQPRQIHHEGILILSIHLLLDAFEIVILAALLELPAQDFLPVGAFLDLLHPLARDPRPGPGGRKCRALGGGFQVVVVEIERLIVIVDLGQVRVAEDVGQDTPLVALLGLQLAGAGPFPAAVPAGLVLPIGGIAKARLGLDVVEPGVFDSVAAGPDVLAGNGAGVAPDTFIEVQHHADLSADFHSAASVGVASLSSQSTFFILRTTTYSSRFDPTVP